MIDTKDVTANVLLTTFHLYNRFLQSEYTWGKEIIGRNKERPDAV